MTKQPIDLGGPVEDVDLSEGRENAKKWQFATDGEVGNGTKAQVQFETYADGNGVRLNGIAVPDLVERTSEPTEDDQIFMVA